MLHAAWGLLQPLSGLHMRYVVYCILFVGGYSLYVGCYRHRVGCYILYACFTCVMWAVTGAVWAVTASMWTVAPSMWNVTACMWTVIDAVWDVTASVHAAYALCGLLHPLCGPSVELCELSHSLSGMLQHACMLHICYVGCFILDVGCHWRRHGTNIGNEVIAFCGGYRAFTNIPRTCPLLITRAYMGLRFDPRRN